MFFVYQPTGRIIAASGYTVKSSESYASVGNIITVFGNAPTIDSSNRTYVPTGMIITASGFWSARTYTPTGMVITASGGIFLKSYVPTGRVITASGFWSARTYIPTGRVITASGPVQNINKVYTSTGGVTTASGYAITKLLFLGSQSSYTLSTKNERLKQNRSNALNSKASLQLSLASSYDLDNFNDKYLSGDTAAIPNLGVNSIIWHYYKERNYEVGVSYNSPSLTPEYYSWTYNWNQLLVASQAPYGDRVDGFFPPDANGAGSQVINPNSTFFLFNGEAVPASGGLIGNISSLNLAVGDSAVYLPQVAGDGTYGDSLTAKAAAVAYLYGSYNPTKIGRGLLGRRTQNATIQVSGSPGVYNWTAGYFSAARVDGFFYENYADSNGYQGNEKTTFLNSIDNLTTSADSNSTYVIFLRDLKTKVTQINSGNNALWTSSNMTPDLKDTPTLISNYLRNISTFVGAPSDTISYNNTIWGYRNWFTVASGGDTVNFNKNLFGLKTVNVNLTNLISSRAAFVDDHTISSVMGAANTNLRKWRYFWTNERIGKPQGSYVSIYGLNTGISMMANQITTAEAPLKTLYGDDRTAHLKYIPTPKSFACYIASTYDRNTGATIKRKSGIVYDGQQHATAYRIYKMAAPAISSSILVADSQWNEATCYATYKDLDSRTNFVSTTYVDSNPNGGDSLPHWWLYRVRTMDFSNKVGGDTTSSVQSNLFDTITATSFTYSSDSRIFFGAPHSFAKNTYVTINNSPQKNGYYYITQSGDTYISVYPTLNVDTSGTVYLSNSVVLI